MKINRSTAVVPILLLAGSLLVSCSDDDSMAQETAVLSFLMTHEFDGLEVDNSTFSQFLYVNENGDTLSISRLRYLISDVALTAQNGDRVQLDNYQLVDVTNGNGLSFIVSDEIPYGTYTGLSFTFGFDEEDNIDEGYPDLNLAVWNWPDMLGGGYHFMQMEGMYLENGVAMPYAYHNGTARVSEGVFEQNYFEADLNGFVVNMPFGEAEIRMNIAEWYRNPNTWDLGEYNITLMPNYDAQKMMQANGASVFSLEEFLQFE